MFATAIEINRHQTFILGAQYKHDKDLFCSIDIFIVFFFLTSWMNAYVNFYIDHCKFY